jgi:murein DD-endopeptidase MepM/ murein hydrolase activator NlpD
LAWPLAPGDYLVVNGGSSLAVNAHADALDQSIPAHRIWRGTAYGVDIVSIDAFGLRATGVAPRDPGRYRIFATPVLAPCAGEIVVAVDGLPDMLAPEYDMANLAGNHVVLHCAKADIVMAHFRRGSVLVSAGARVSTGQKLAEVGNSGGTNEPHLHIHAQSPGTIEAPISGAPLPMRFEGRWLVRSDRWHEPAMRGPAP